MKYDNHKHRWKTNRNTFITSDNHFDHKNIIKYCNRPFTDSKEMDEAMIYRWNSVVGYEDLVIHLGDFGLGNEGYIRSIRNRLNGNIVMVFGNHSSIERKLNWYKTFDYLELKVAKYPSLALSHYAHRIWNKMHKGTWHLYGHSHGTLPEDPHFKSFDVGVDSHNFTPWSMEEIAKKMATKQ